MDHTHALLDGVLSDHVLDGLVDYAALQRDDADPPASAGLHEEIERIAERIAGYRFERALRRLYRERQVNQYRRQ